MKFNLLKSNMKKFLILLVSLIFLACSNNPNSDKPVEFMGLPLQGDAYAFGDSLTAKGFEYKFEDEGLRILYEGKYLNHDAGVFVCYNPESKEVRHIQVAYLEDHPDKESIITDFNKKYGECKIRTDEKAGEIYTWRVNCGRISLVLGGPADLLLVYSNNPSDKD